MPNRLAAATSPYLLQHADNPVDWWEWSDEAFAEAARRDVPVVLSVGYAACHWCHVMAHESFEDEATAKQLNADFVAVKVDREERPDIDAVYMAATQAMTGQGGWPMTCFLTPAGEPFHCGTYYPPTSRAGMPGFRQLLDAVTRAWRDDGERVRRSAGEIAARLADNAAAALPPSPVGPESLERAADTLIEMFDGRFGGFGGAPKFPPSMALEFLLRHYERTGAEHVLRPAALTCERMARGGMYDQLAGGFARYSVDAQWIVPHFEKMLYDNALLLRVYAHLARITGEPFPRRIAEETAAFLLGDLRTAEGGFASALDADTDGVEGLTYSWTPQQLREVLGDDDGNWAATLLTVTERGTFEHGSSTLQLLADPDDPERWERVRAALLASRKMRPQPARDDKVITAWNGMAMLALAEGGAALDRPDWVDAAAEAADLLLRLHLVDGRLRRSSRDGAVGTAAGVLEDYGSFAEGLLALHQATGSPRWLTAATELLDVALEHFADPERPGSFYDTADDAETLLHRPREFTDNATPCGSSATVSALLTASVLVADPARYRDAAEEGLRGAGTLAEHHPRFAGHWLTAAEAMVRGPLQVAVVGPDGDASRDALLAHARHIAAGGTVIVPGEPGAAGVPLLADRPLVDGLAAAYVCRGFVCDRPVTATEELTASLGLRP
ncbi:thioredoxin domain-containing protein [Pseudonocardia alaniniphila]|uniref:Thioredoxin domain-containing protein n=1 Tax=Pseudonocardia alaniniphila TaxID=75291 RepID=A0ABS9THX8_9PSEU|nr:thioredoxin domain-containing protein [Pseudonocardia alaniniphila]MCH6168093.1 thioredoxin domain-containing protein [Pseudonocardia alaniniphila]